MCIGKIAYRLNIKGTQTCYSHNQHLACNLRRQAYHIKASSKRFILCEMATIPATTNVTIGKFVSEPKETYPLSIENLVDIVAYSPNATHPDSLVSQVFLPAGSLFTPITTATEVRQKKWSTVQVSQDKYVELNSALLYMNHSCRPSLEVDADLMEVRVTKDRDLQVGDELTFFYPSTEWQMDKPFLCLCGAGSGCLGTVTGAADIEAQKLRKWLVNEHIVKLKSAQTSKIE